MTRCFLILGLAGMVADTAVGQSNRKPNIVVIVGDDMGYADVGFHGCMDIPTPNLDALAKSGVRFSNGYVSGPYCSPTRAGLMTGRYQTRFGHEFNPAGADSGLPVSEQTMANIFHEAGYATGLIGKWHLGSKEKFHPLNRGFDEFFGFLGGAHSYFPDKGAGILRNHTAVQENEYLTDAIGRESVAFIERHQAKPFFLYVAFNAVHTPMHATDDRLAKFAEIPDKTRRTYAAMMFAMDEAIGRIVEAIRSRNLEEDTLIVFFSDNGGPVLESTTVNGSRNTPLRGSKRTTLEGGIRVPFVMSWKGHLPADKLYESPVIQLDVLPTAMAAARIGNTTKHALDGVNLLPYLSAETEGAPHDKLYWRFGQQMAIRSGNWMLVRYDAQVDRAVKGRRGNVTEPRLYNLANDIGQVKNLAAENPDKTRELQAAWDRWNSGLVPALWGAENRERRRARNAAGG